MPAAPSRFAPPRDLAETLAELRAFWESDFPFQGGSPAVVDRLQGEFGRHFPEPLARYLSSAVPAKRVVLEGVGNPIELWPHGELTAAPVGYRVGTRGETLDGWSPAWLVIADEGADPVAVDLDSSSDGDCPVLQAMHGEGEWSFSAVADSIPQYLLMAGALHHALKTFPDAIVDGPDGLELAEPAAAWLLPRMRGWAGAHYEHWMSAFHNA